MRLDVPITNLKVVHYHYPSSSRFKEYFIECNEVGDKTKLVNFVCRKCQLPVAYYLPRESRFFALTKNVGLVLK